MYGGSRNVRGVEFSILALGLGRLEMLLLLRLLFLFYYYLSLRAMHKKPETAASP